MWHSLENVDRSLTHTEERKGKGRKKHYSSSFLQVTCVTVTEKRQPFQLFIAVAFAVTALVHVEFVTRHV